jgi:hypothetical protein
MVEKCQEKPKVVATKLQTFSWGSRAVGAIFVSFGGGVLIDTIGTRGTFGILGLSLSPLLNSYLEPRCKCEQHLTPHVLLSCFPAVDHHLRLLLLGAQASACRLQRGAEALERGACKAVLNSVE